MDSSQILIERAGQMFSRSELIDGALEKEDSVSDRNIDVHVNGLRKKLGRYGERIETVRGFGYKFQYSDYLD